MNEQILEMIRAKKGFICDMDGVIYHGNQLLPPAKAFVEWLQRENKQFLFLTNSSERSRTELRQKLQRMGLDIPEEHFYTSAIATARFLAKQKPGCSVYCVGEAGLLNAIYEEGLTINDVNPDYVVVGPTQNYSFANMSKAVNLVRNGAKLIGTNPDTTAPAEGGRLLPDCAALVAPIEISTGKKAYYLGKPNPLMMRSGFHRLGCKSEDAVVIGDRMETDIIPGVESGATTVLVLSGVSTIETVEQFPYRPTVILDDVGCIIK